MGEFKKEIFERLDRFAKQYNLSSPEEAVNFLLNKFSDSLREALSFNDVTLDTGFAEFVPDEADISTYITKELKQPTPITSAAMDTVTESEMAIVMAQLGGSGVIHRGLTIEDQVHEVKKVKYAWNLLIQNPRTINKDQTLRDVLIEMKKYDISGLPVLDGEYVVGITTKKDTKYHNLDTLVGKIMTPKSKLIYINENESFSQKQYFELAKPILKKNKIDKLLVIKKVDGKYLLKGLITSQDVKKRDIYKDASLVDGKTLLVGAAIGCKTDKKEKENDFDRAEELLKHGKVDYIVIDSSHGGSEGVVYMTKELKKLYKDQIQLIAGNICNGNHAKDLIDAGADALKVGVGPGATCRTRTISGVGIPQITATYNVALVANQYNIPVITDGGFEEPGDVAKAIGAGSSAIMTGYLFRATKETPGELFQKGGKYYKKYRGMGSLDAMLKGSGYRYHVDEILLADWMLKENILKQPTEQGVSVEVPSRGFVATHFNEIIGGLRIAMGLTGNRTIDELRRIDNFNEKFYKITPAGKREGGVHGF